MCIRKSAKASVEAEKEAYTSRFVDIIGSKQNSCALIYVRRNQCETLIHPFIHSKCPLNLGGLFIGVSMTPLYSVNQDLSNRQFWLLFMIRLANHPTQTTSSIMT